MIVKLLWTSILIYPFSVLKTINGTAISPDDYLHASRDIVIAPGDIKDKEMIITIENDNKTEGMENILLELTTSNINQINIARSSASVEIEDDDGNVFPPFSFRYLINFKIMWWLFII